jgi:hypothetical protein
MSISAVGGGAGYTPYVPTSQPAQPASSTTPAKDTDHDHDTDTPGRLDVRA